ncbi:MAG: hypothetical protein AB1568_04840 [Thermodesulfobacteriota bacterium]
MSTVNHSPHPVNPAATPGGDGASPSQGSETRISSDPVVANCLDTLKISFWVHWSSPLLLEKLEEAKTTAQAGEKESEPVDLEGFEFNVMRSGTARFSYRLERGDLRLLLNTRDGNSKLPNLKVEIGSVSCWAPGYRDLYEKCLSMIEFFGGCVVKERVSEVHMAADSIGLDLGDVPVHRQEHWITKAIESSTHYHNRRLEGITLGQGNIMLRIYDKVGELKMKSVHKQPLFAQIWGLEEYNDKPVTRTEFQIRRDVLRDFKPKVDTFADMENSLDSLWAYCMKWCRLTEKPANRDHHQSRAVNHPWWSQLENVRWPGDSEVHRCPAPPQANLRQLLALSAGAAMSIAAIVKRRPDDLEGIITMGQGFLEGELRRRFHDKKDFTKRMQRKLNQVQGAFQDSKPKPDLPNP